MAPTRTVSEASESGQHRHRGARPCRGSGACLAAATIDAYLLDSRLGEERCWPWVTRIRQADGQDLAFQAVDALARLAGVGARLRRETERRRLGQWIKPIGPTYIT